MASKCISKLARSRPPSASPNSLDHGVQLHFPTCSIAVSKCISKVARSRLLIASPKSLDRGLQVHLQTCLITASKYISEFNLILASKCISKLAWSWPPSASLSYPIFAAKCIAKLAQSGSRSVSLSSLNRHFQVHLDAGQDRVFISYNEMSIYPGVSELYTACRWVHLRYSCISECTYIERLR